MEDIYKGYVKIKPNEQDLANFYMDPTQNIFNLVTNQYYILENESEVFEKGIWNGYKYDRLRYKSIDNNWVGKVKPRNPQQECAFDLLQDKETTVKVLTGRFGSGKTFLMVVNALQALYEKRFEKIVWIRNNIAVKDTKDLGALPGSEFEKLLPFVGPLADQVGGDAGVEMLIRNGQLDVQHLGFIRGRDLKNSIIMCSEAENLTTQHVQLLIGRVGEGSNLWLDGDFKQTDMKVFEENNGLRKCIEKLKGNKLFGYVNLEKSERSETAALADLLDN